MVSLEDEAMKMFHSSRATGRPWPMKKPQSKLRSFFSLPLLALLFSLLFFFIFYFSLSPNAVFFISSKSLIHRSNSLHCTSPSLSLDEKFLFYAPHSGFSNQLSEFKNAILMAGILNRTLVVPPVLDHHAVALGSCPKFRVLDPKEIRLSVWEHIIDLTRSGRYISMADIVDISSLISSSSLRAIDFRAFVALLCGVSMDFACSNESYEQSTLSSSLKQCGSQLSGLDGNIESCLYAVSDDCRSTVWTYQNGKEDGGLDSFQPSEQFQKKKKVSYSRRRRDVYKAFGPGSEAEGATLLAFGSLFTAPYKGSELYIDIHEIPRDQRIQSLIKTAEFLPFVPEIMSAGKDYADKIIGSPFLCAQLRLLDGQFKNHREATFIALKQKLDSLRERSPQLIHVFVMTDLPESNWTKHYLGHLARDSKRFKLYFLKDDDELVAQTAKKLIKADHGLRLGPISTSTNKMDKLRNKCGIPNSSDVRLFIEEIVCSCASLGFVGTAGSTIAESIELMRKHKACSN